MFAVSSFIIVNYDDDPFYSVHAEALLTEKKIEITADFSDLLEIEDAILYLYTPHAFYSLGNTTAESPIFGNDLRTDKLKDHIARASHMSKEDAGLYLSTGITHPGKAKTTFHLQKQDGPVEIDKFRLFVVTTEKGWFKTSYHVEEIKVNSFKD
ncbi:hypothetical protein [Tumebacillus sp. BK434]|uniref:hypothetical protein n=1 Tax=Tumebacillus sp. BK434 TaxID=2512169 RepID=UPI00104E2B6F|nr:hypothetical protein [Tumebacillus sp. BK434]